MARPRTPTQLKVVGGNPGKRALNKQEPDPEYVTDLTPPDWLPERAKTVWSEIAPQLVKAKLLTDVDVQMLGMGCVAIAQFRCAVHKTGDDLVKGKADKDSNGNVVQVGEHINPWQLVQSMSFKQAMAVFQRFGMSPADRTRIAINPQGDLFGNANGDQGPPSKAASYFK